MARRPSPATPVNTRAQRRRREHLATRLRRGSVLAAVLGLALGGWWLWSQDIIPHTWHAGRSWVLTTTAEQGLAVGRITLLGRERANLRDVAQAIDIAEGAPLLAVDLNAIKARLEQLSWVEHAAVERRFPDEIRLTLTERTPLALWQHQGQVYVIDRQGVVIDEGDASSFNGLPLVVGGDAASHAAGLLRLLASEPALYDRFMAAVRVGGRRWNVRLSNAPDGEPGNATLDIKLPEDGLEQAWKRLAYLHGEGRILDRAVTGVDLRFADRVFIRMTDATIRALPDPSRPAPPTTPGQAGPASATGATLRPTFLTPQP